MHRFACRVSGLRAECARALPEIDSRKGKNGVKRVREESGSIERDREEYLK